MRNGQAPGGVGIRRASGIRVTAWGVLLSGKILVQSNRTTGEIMRIRTKTTITSAGKVRIKTAVKAAPMLPTLRASATYAVIPSAVPARRKRRRRKKKR